MSVNSVNMCSSNVNFRSHSQQYENPINYSTPNLPPNNLPPQQKNSIGLTENGQKVLNKTNEYANAYEIADTLTDSEKRKDKNNLAMVAKNTMLMPIMSDPIVSGLYTANKYKKGEISKEEATKIMIYNAIAQL